MPEVPGVPTVPKVHWVGWLGARRRIFRSINRWCGHFVQRSRVMRSISQQIGIILGWRSHCIPPGRGGLSFIPRVCRLATCACAATARRAAVLAGVQGQRLQVSPTSQGGGTISASKYCRGIRAIPTPRVRSVCANCESVGGGTSQPHRGGVQLRLLVGSGSPRARVRGQEGHQGSQWSDPSPRVESRSLSSARRDFRAFDRI